VVPVYASVPWGGGAEIPPLCKTMYPFHAAHNWVPVDAVVRCNSMYRGGRRRRDDKRRPRGRSIIIVLKLAACKCAGCRRRQTDDRSCSCVDDRDWFWRLAPDVLTSNERHLRLLVTNRLAETVMRSVVSVRPCVSTLFLNQLNIILYACADHDHSSPKIESQGHRVRLKVSAKCVYYTSIYCGFLWVLIHGRSNRFPLWRYQLPVSAARRAAWRGRGWRQRRSSACVSEVALSVTP